MADTKAMTLRIDAEKAAELEAVARVDQVPVSEAVRVAIEEHIERRRRDTEFMAQLQRIVERDREILERLAR